MIIIPRCHDRHCVNLVGVRQPDDTEQTERNVCLAFPEGIPLEIVVGENLHSVPLPDQENDIVFEEEET